MTVLLTPVSGLRTNAPWGPTSRTRTRLKARRFRRYCTLNRAQFDYWCRTGKIWRHQRPPILGAANLIQGDFDDGTDQSFGSSNTNCTVAATTAQQQAGTHSLAITITGAGAWSTRSDEFAVTPGTSYFAAGWVRTAVTSRSVAIQILFYNSSHTLLSTNPGTGVSDSTSAWTRATAGMFTAPATAAFARVGVAAGAGAASEVHYVDTVVADTTSANALSVAYLEQGAGTYRAASIATDGFDITEAQILCWGGGGGGGVRSGVGGITPGAGGGGGAYAETFYTLTPDTVYALFVGGGGAIAGAGQDTWFDSTSGVNADSGKGATNNTPGAGGTVAGSTGTIRFKGGEGGAGSGSTGGGGGGGAGTSGNGGNASGTTPGTGTFFNGGNGGAQNVAGSAFGGGGGGAQAVTGTAGTGGRGGVIVNPTKFRVQNDVISEHVVLLTRAIVAARSFAAIQEHVLARTLNVSISHPVISEHVISQGAKSVVKTAFPVISEHVIAMTRAALAFRIFSVIQEHVTALTQTLVLARSFAVIQEHVISQQKLINTTHSVIQEHVTSLARSLVASRSFAVIQEHVLTQQKLLIKRAFEVISEHVTALTRTVVLSRTFSVISEHVTLLSRSLVLTRSFDVISEHDISLTRSLVASRIFNVISEHEVSHTRSLVATRTFSVISEHDTTLTRTLGLQRNFEVISEHDISVTKILTFVRDFFVIQEHLVTAAVCMDFDDVPTGGGGGGTVIRPLFVFDD